MNNHHNKLPDLGLEGVSILDAGPEIGRRFEIVVNAQANVLGATAVSGDQGAVSN